MSNELASYCIVEANFLRSKVLASGFSPWFKRKMVELNKSTADAKIIFNIKVRNLLPIRMTLGEVREILSGSFGSTVELRVQTKDHSLSHE